jgi:hypothetical protein
MQQTAERRDKPRLAIIEEVFDQNTGESIGHTADLNAYGMMMIGGKTFNIGEETRIFIYIPINKRKNIKTSLTAQCRWSEQHLNTPFFNSGFKFIYTNEFDIEYIETLFYGLTE